MAVYDIPEAIAVVRNAVCAAPSAAAGFASLSRLQVRVACVWVVVGGSRAVEGDSSVCADILSQRKQSAHPLVVELSAAPNM